MRVYGERYEALRRNFQLARRAKAVPSARFAAPYRLASIAYKRCKRLVSSSLSGRNTFRRGLADDAVWSSVLALRDRYASEVITLNVTGRWRRSRGRLARCYGPGVRQIRHVYEGR